jgi:REP element-mobilizing transposase RayT
VILSPYTRAKWIALFPLMNPITCQHFWARGYFVSTVGRDTEVIRDYIRKQEEEDMRLEQMNLWR